MSNVCAHFETINDLHPNCRLGEPLQGCGSECPIYLPDAARQPCEIWTRVMGYHRPVSAFNAGKRAEHDARKYFREDIHD